MENLNQSLRARLAAVAVFLGLLVAAPAFAQTGSELLLKPFPKELRMDGSADLSFQENGHAKKTDADFQLSTYEVDGRVRLNPGDVASPRFGYSLKYLDLDTSVVG